MALGMYSVALASEGQSHRTPVELASGVLMYRMSSCASCSDPSIPALISSPRGLIV